MKKNGVAHFEIYADDTDALSTFYTTLFDWTIEHRPGMEGYGFIKTVDTGAKGVASQPGGINGGIYGTPPGATKELNAFSCVIGVENVDQSMDKVKAAGGELLGDKMDIPTIGTFIRCRDTEGNIFTMLQPLPPST